MSNQQKQQPAPAPKPPAAETQKPVEQPKSEVQTSGEQGKTESQTGEQKQAPETQPKQEEKPAAAAPAPAAAPLPENKLQRDPKLPSDEFPMAAVNEPAPAKTIEGAEAALVSAIDTLLKYLLTDATHWKAGVPEVGDSWQPIYEQVLQGMRPVDGQPIEPARLLVQKHQVVLRCFGGATPKEKIVVVRVMGTKYLRSELLPWTIGK